MDNTEIAGEILDALAEAHNPDDIILGLCDKYKLSWPEAEALVLRVQQENAEEITLRQAPLLTLLALVTFIAGWVLLALGIYPIAAVGIPLLQHGDLTKLLDNWQFRLWVDTVIHTGLNPLMSIPLGVGLILGSLLGMRDVWAAILQKMKIWA